MDTLSLDPQTVDAYKTILTDPTKYAMPFRAIQDCFEKSEQVTAKHLLAKAYMENEATQLPKIICYIIMDQIFGTCNGKDEKGLAGYYLQFKPSEK